MDWTGWDTNIYLNKHIIDEDKNFKLIYSEHIEPYVNTNLIGPISNTNINIALLFHIVQPNFLLRQNPIRYLIAYKKTFENINLTNINDIYFLNNITMIPLIPSIIKYNMYEFYFLIKNVNINSQCHIMVYHDNNNKFKTALSYLNINNVNYYKNKKHSANNFDIWFANSFDNYNMDDCRWFFFRFNWYYNQLFYIAKNCKNMATIIISFDYRFLELEIYVQLLTLFSCFMKIRVYNNVIMPYPKFYIIGYELDLKKLKKFCKKNEIIKKYDELILKIDNVCINKKPVITSFNLKSHSIINIIAKLKEKYKFFCNKYLSYIYKYNNTKEYETYINYTLKYNIERTYNIIKDTPFIMNEYYRNIPKKVIFSISCLNKKYFPNINSVDFNKLELTPYVLHKAIYIKEVKKMTDIIFKIIGHTTILDATSNCGSNTISFASKFKKVISLESIRKNYNSLMNNVEEYNFTNVKMFNDDCITFIKNDNYKYKNIFFDPPWEEICSYKETPFELFGIPIDDIVLDILKHNKNARIFIRAPYNFNSTLKCQKFPIKNYLLLYFNNTIFKQ